MAMKTLKLNLDDDKILAGPPFWKLATQNELVGVSIHNEGDVAEYSIWINFSGTTICAEVRKIPRAEHELYSDIFLHPAFKDVGREIWRTAVRLNYVDYDFYQEAFIVAGIVKPYSDPGTQTKYTIQIKRHEILTL